MHDRHSENISANYSLRPDYEKVIKPYLDNLNVPVMSSVVIEEVPESHDQDTYDPMDTGSEAPPKKTKEWTDNPFYKSNGTKKTQKTKKPEYNGLHKGDFVLDEALEDNIESPPPSPKIKGKSKKRASPTEHAEAKDMKVLALTVKEQNIIALADKWSKSNTKYRRLSEKKCTEGEENCPLNVTPFYNDGMCGPCRSKAKKKAQRKRNNELKALRNQHEAQLEEINHRAAVAKAKEEMLNDLQEGKEALGSESDADDSSDNEENDS